MKPVLRRGAALLSIGLLAAVAACGSDDDSSSTGTESSDAAGVETSAGADTSSDTASSGGSAADSATAAEARVAEYLERATTISIDEPLTSAPEPGVSVYWVTPNLQSQQPTTDGLIAATDAVGWDLTTLQTESSDPQAVPSAIQQAVDGGADYIVVSGGSVDQYGASLDAAKSAGIPVIDMYSSDEVGGEENGIYANIGGTGWIEKQYPVTADFIISDSGGDARVLYVDIPDFPILAAASAATNAQFADQCPDCVVTPLDVSVTDLTGGAVASLVVSTLQREADIDYVFTSFGDLASGLPQALDAAGLADRVKVVTATPNTEQVQGVIDGTILAAVPNPKAQASWTVIDAIARLEQGLEIDQEQHTVIPIEVWTVDTVPKPAAEFAGAEGYEDQFKQLWQLS